MNHRQEGEDRGKSSKLKAFLSPRKHFFLVHLHLRLGSSINGYGEVKSDIDNGKEEEEKEGRNKEQGLSQHGAVGIGELQLEVLNVSLSQKLPRTSGEDHNSPTSGVEVGDPLRQDDLDLRLLDQHVVVDVVNKAHVEHVDVALVEDVLVAGHVVADHVVGFPATEEREPWAQIKLNGIVHHLKMTGAYVSNVVPVVNVLGSGRQQGFEVLDT